MSFTRFHDDPARMEKQLEMITKAGRYSLDVPGNGPNPAYFTDPFIRLQKWGGNLRTNCINVGSYLRGLDNTIGLTCTLPPQPPSKEIEYPSIGQITHQPRATNPAWEIKGNQRENFTYLHEDPQFHIEAPFPANLNSRLIERDHFVAKAPCPNLSE